MNEQWRERFSGIDRLYGAGTVARLAGCRVAVVGLGGVGGADGRSQRGAVLAEEVDLPAARQPGCLDAQDAPGLAGGVRAVLAVELPVRVQTPIELRALCGAGGFGEGGSAGDAGLGQLRQHAVGGGMPPGGR